MSPALSPKAAAALREKIDKRTGGPSPEIPGLIYTAVNRQGDVVFSHASGSRGIDVGDPMTHDTTFWLASCTKLITSIACMQLVEQGRLRLDDVEQVEQLAPELKDVKVIEPNGHNRFRLGRKQQGITLRMLLTHTGGCKFAHSLRILRDIIQKLKQYSWLRIRI
jgi:CubicO group peptidase (beta-lactamase class C family)